MSHKYEHVSTGAGFSVLNDGVVTEVIAQDGTVVADIKDTLTEGSIYVGNSSDVTSELAIGTSGYVLTSNGTTAAWAVSGVPNGTTVTATNDTAVGATLDLFQDSASPAAFDAVATLNGKGNSDTAAEVTYGNVSVGIIDPTDGTEEGAVAINVVTAGTLTAGPTAPFVVTGTAIKETVPTYLEQTEQDLSGAGAVDVTSQVTAWNCSGAVAGTLADGSSGQVKRIYCSAYVGDGTLTPTNLLGFSTITFTAVGQSVMLHFNGSAWVIDANHGATIA